MKRLIPALIALLLLAGCVEYDEELWINSDGSGKATLRIVHRSSYANADEVLRKASLPGITLTEQKISKVGPDVVYQISFTFKDVESFNNVNDQIGTADFWGKITINREPGGKIGFKRRIALGSQDSGDDLENLFSQAQVDHPVWKYKVHLPWKVLSANADEPSIDRASKTVSWEFDTRQLWNRDEYMTVEMEKGTPWIPMILVAVAVILLGFLAFWMIRISRRSHLLERIEHESEKKEE